MDFDNITSRRFCRRNLRMKTYSEFTVSLDSSDTFDKLFVGLKPGNNTHFVSEDSQCKLSSSSKEFQVSGDGMKTQDSGTLFHSPLRQQKRFSEKIIANSSSNMKSKNKRNMSRLKKTTKKTKPASKKVRNKSRNYKPSSLFCNARNSDTGSLVLDGTGSAGNPINLSPRVDILSNSSLSKLSHIDSENIIGGRNEIPTDKFTHKNLKRPLNAMSTPVCKGLKFMAPLHLTPMPCYDVLMSESICTLPTKFVSEADLFEICKSEVLIDTVNEVERDISMVTQNDALEFQGDSNSPFSNMDPLLVKSSPLENICELKDCIVLLTPLAKFARRKFERRISMATELICPEGILDPKSPETINECNLKDCVVVITPVQCSTYDKIDNEAFNKPVAIRFSKKLSPSLISEEDAHGLCRTTSPKKDIKKNLFKLNFCLENTSNSRDGQQGNSVLNVSNSELKVQQEVPLAQVGRKGRRYSNVYSSVDKDNSEIHEKHAIPPICDIQLKGGKGWRRTIMPLLNPLRDQPLSKNKLNSRKTILVQHDNAFDSDLLSSCERSDSEDLFSSRSILEVPITEKVLSLCGQQQLISFDDWCGQKVNPYWKKIGEGVFGEVFIECSSLASKVYKVVPVDGSTRINDDDQMKLEDIYGEMMLTKSLSLLRDGKSSSCELFVKVFNFHFVKGMYPRKLLELWADYDEAKGSENECPDKLPVDQVYLVFELANAGTDLEKYIFSSCAQATSAFYQICLALAVAESSLEFEHRDLHWGNVLISQISEKTICVNLNDEVIQIHSRGIRCNIIDYSLSRMKTKCCVIFQDLSDNPWLFEGKGDIQFDVYREMRKFNGGDWEKFCPYTNILWLHYLISKICTSSTFKRKTKDHSKGMRKLRMLKENILKYDCAVSFVKSLSFK